MAEGRRQNVSHRNGNGKMIGLEVLDAADRYFLADVFDISTENLILEKALMKKVV